MAAVLDRSDHPKPRPGQPSLETDLEPGSRRRLLRRRFSVLQLVVLCLATIAPVVILGTFAAALLGAITVEQMTTVALAAGENPGMITFGAMFLASPVQWLTGRSQVRVRKYLGIAFFLLALSNGALFIVESGLTATLGAPFLVAGTAALALAGPLFLTSSRWSQKAMGMRRWRLLHKLTYVVAAALLAHVALIGDVGPGAVMIAVGFVSRVPAVRRRLGRIPRREVRSTTVPSGRPVPRIVDDGSSRSFVAPNTGKEEQL